MKRALTIILMLVAAPAWAQFYDNGNDPSRLKWQSIDSPMSVSVTPAFLDTSTGAVDVGSAVANNVVFAVLMDRDAAGVVQVNEWSDSIWNPRGGYTNMFWHFTQKYWNSFTENCLVFTLD